MIRSVNFGSSRAGLVTVGYRLRAANGTYSARVTAGVTEDIADSIGTGVYKASVTEGTNVAILWDTGETPPRFAMETLFPGVDVRAWDGNAESVQVQLAAGLAPAPLVSAQVFVIGTSAMISLAQTIWNRLTSALTTAGSIGKLLVDTLNATIGSRAVPGDAMTLGGEQAAQLSIIPDIMQADVRAEVQPNDHLHLVWRDPVTQDEIMRKELYDVAGTVITQPSQIIGQAVKPE